MKKILAMVVLGIAFPMTAAADVTKEDILKLTGAGISQDVIVNFIKANAPVRNFTADELVELKKKGVGDRVLAALTAKPAKPAPRPAPRPKAPRTSVVREWRAPVSYYYYSRPYYSTFYGLGYNYSHSGHYSSHYGSHYGSHSGTHSGTHYSSGYGFHSGSHSGSHAGSHSGTHH